jgi:hypothetical protein
LLLDFAAEQRSTSKQEKHGGAKPFASWLGKRERCPTFPVRGMPPVSSRPSSRPQLFQLLPHPNNIKLRIKSQQSGPVANILNPNYQHSLRI